MKIMITETASTKPNYRVDIRCEKCFLKTYQRLFEKFNVSLTQQQKFISFFQESVRVNNHLSSPEFQKLLNNNFCGLIEIPDPFDEEKINSNRAGLLLYAEWKPKVLISENNFDLALRLALAGNIMDYGASNSFDIQKTIETVLTSSFAIDHSKQLKKAVNQAKRILYLGDNAGEIVFDKLFIETIMHKNDITFAVKGAPILNDVTVKDANEIGMAEVADIVSNGFDAPSTVLEQCSKEFLDVYYSADLIISKGQGNFEGLLHKSDSRIFFLMMVKCDVIAEILHVEKGSFVVYNQSK